MLFSDKKAKSPNYDLAYFADKIDKNLKVIEAGKPTLISSKEQKKDGNFNLNDYWLWIIIIGVALLLAYMSYGMIKDRKE
jgi:hypothetical protein